MLRRLLYSSAIAFAAAAVPSVKPPGDAFEYQQVHMGLPVRIVLHVQDRERADVAARAAFARIDALDRVMSDYRPDSELRRLTAGGTEWTSVSAPLLDVLDRAVSIASATGGAFDPTIGPLVALWRESRVSGILPDASAIADARRRVGWKHVEIDRARGAVRLGRRGMRLDLGGIAKGYILQQALDTLRRAGADSALIESGGDIVVGDAPRGRVGWQIDAPGVDAAFRARASSLTHAALATSGSTEQFVEIEGIRYSHLIDPRTALGVTQPVVARVIAADAATADALATALAVGDNGVHDAVRRRFPEVSISLSSR